MPVLDSSLWKRSIKDLLVELLRDNTDEFLVLVGGKETSDNDSSSAIESAPVNFSFFFFCQKLNQLWTLVLKVSLEMPIFPVWQMSYFFFVYCLARQQEQDVDLAAVILSVELQIVC